MRQFIVIISFLVLLSGCVSSETTVIKNSGNVAKKEFDPKAAAEIRIQLALAHLKKNNLPQAKENIEKALEYQPNDASIYRVLAYYYQQVNEVKTAEQLFKKSLSLDSNDPNTYAVYGSFLCEQERYQEADNAFMMAIKQPKYSGVANAYEKAGKCAQQAGEVDKALSYYQSSLSHNPNKSRLHLAMAKLYIDKEEYKYARLSLFSYQKESKYSAESLWQWIRLSYKTGKSASLRNYARKLLTEFPESQQSLDYLNHEYE